MNGVLRNIRREFMTATGAEQVSLCREIVQPVEGLEQDLLPFHEIVGILRMQRIVFRRVEIEKFREILPAPDVAELEVIGPAVDFLEAQPFDLAERIDETVLRAADTAGHLDDEAAVRLEAEFRLLRTAMRASEHLLPMPCEHRHIRDLDLPAALAIKSHAAKCIHQHKNPLLSP